MKAEAINDMKNNVVRCTHCSTIFMTRSPQSDAAANGPNAKDELYKLSCKLERENARLLEVLGKMYNTPTNCPCEVSDEISAIWKEAGDILSNDKDHS